MHFRRHIINWASLLVATQWKSGRNQYVCIVDKRCVHFFFKLHFNYTNFRYINNQSGMIRTKLYQLIVVRRMQSRNINYYLVILKKKTKKNSIDLSMSYLFSFIFFILFLQLFLVNLSFNVFFSRWYSENSTWKWILSRNSESVVESIIGQINLLRITLHRMLYLKLFLSTISFLSKIQFYSFQAFAALLIHTFER